MGGSVYAEWGYMAMQSDSQIGDACIMAVIKEENSTLE